MKTEKPKAGFIAGQSKTITQFPSSERASNVTFDFTKCSRGSDVVYFGLGSSHFAFEGDIQNNCIFYYGTEMESPDWDRLLQFKCRVPVSLGKRTYTVGPMGISMQEMEKYCVSL